MLSSAFRLFQNQKTSALGTQQGSPWRSKPGLPNARRCLVALTGPAQRKPRKGKTSHCVLSLRVKMDYQTCET